MTGSEKLDGDRVVADSFLGQSASVAIPAVWKRRYRYKTPNSS